MIEVFAEGLGVQTLTDGDFFAIGGEASLYRRGDLALKVYHQPERAPAAAKLRELNAIGAKNVLKPLDFLFDPKNGKPLGVTMPFVSGTKPLVRYFSAAFKSRKGLDIKAIHQLVVSLQETLVQIHHCGCLVGDLNEMNLLVADQSLKPYFIDVDSYQTPNFPVTAIADSIRDPKSKVFSELTDWFAFAVLAFQMYVGIHPYKGGHPDYKNGAWRQRMVDGVSVFDPRSVLPGAADDWNRIPAYHLGWFQTVFRDNNRCPPPPPRTKVNTLSMVTGPTRLARSRLKLEIIFKLPGAILAAFPHGKQIFCFTADSLFQGETRLMGGINGHRAWVVQSSRGQSILVTKGKDYIRFQQVGGTYCETIPFVAGFCRQGCFYSVDGQFLMGHQFNEIGGRVVRTASVEGIHRSNHPQVFEGFLIRYLLGRTWMMNPLEPGKCSMKAVPELDGYRVVSGRAEGSYCQLVAERKGTYSLFFMKTPRDGTGYDVWPSACDFHEPNFTALPNGLCVWQKSEAEIELFVNPRHRRSLAVPLSRPGNLFHAAGEVYVLKENQVVRIGTN